MNHNPIAAPTNLVNAVHALVRMYTTGQVMPSADISPAHDADLRTCVARNIRFVTGPGIMNVAVDDGLAKVFLASALRGLDNGALDATADVTDWVRAAVHRFAGDLTDLPDLDFAPCFIAPADAERWYRRPGYTGPVSTSEVSEKISRRG